MVTNGDRKTNNLGKLVRQELGLFSKSWFSEKAMQGPPIDMRTTSTTLVRGAAVHVCVRYAWFCFWEPQPDIGARRGTVQSRRAPRSGLPSSVLGGLNRYVTHLFDHIATSLSSTLTHIGDRHSPDGEASMQTREIQAFLFATERGA